MRHRTRTKATHLMTVTRRQETAETDEYGQPIQTGDDYETVVEDERVDFAPSGTSFDRTATGEMVNSSPQVKGRDMLAYDIQAGDTVSLTPLDDPGVERDGLEVVSVKPQYGRWKKPAFTVLELEVA